MNVIVEPDVVGPWLGLVGVAVGVLLTAGVTGLQQRRKDKRNRRAELLSACTELDAAVQNVRIYSGAFRALRPPPSWTRRTGLLMRRRKLPADPYFGDSPLAWAGAQAAAMERVNTLAATIARLAPEPVSSAAWAVARDAFLVMRGSEEASGQLTDSAIEFRQIRAQVLGA